MPLNWIDVTPLHFNTLLLLERVQLSWLPGWAPEKELAIALQANPAVEWFLRHKCPEIAPWVDLVAAQAPPSGSLSPEQVRQAEIQVLGALEDLVVYAVEPVGNLRSYIKAKARRLGYSNVYPVDGLITDLPFPEGFADVILSGHVFGNDPPRPFPIGRCASPYCPKLPAGHRLR